MILYIETNFLVAVAKGQEQRADELLDLPADRLTIVLPDVCVMEAFVVRNAIATAAADFQRHLNRQIDVLRRDPASGSARMMLAGLERASVAHADVLGTNQQRLGRVLGRASGRCEIVPITWGVVAGVLSDPPIDDWTDALILATVEAHAAGADPDAPKALLTANVKDFDAEPARRLLRRAGVRYFAASDAFLGWYRSLSGGKPDPESP